MNEVKDPSDETPFKHVGLVLECTWLSKREKAEIFEILHRVYSLECREDEGAYITPLIISCLLEFAMASPAETHLIKNAVEMGWQMGIETKKEFYKDDSSKGAH